MPTGSSCNGGDRDTAPREVKILFTEEPPRKKFLKKSAQERYTPRSRQEGVETGGGSVTPQKMSFGCMGLTGVGRKQWLPPP